MGECEYEFQGEFRHFLDSGIGVDRPYQPLNKTNYEVGRDSGAQVGSHLMRLIRGGEVETNHHDFDRFQPNLRDSNHSVANKAAQEPVNSPSFERNFGNGQRQNGGQEDPYRSPNKAVHFSCTIFTPN